MMSRPTRRDLLQLIGAGALSAGLPAPMARAAVKALDKATITLDWRVTGYHAPFFVGLDQGLFAKHGIDLTVNPGNGSRNTIVAVAANNTNFGMADATALPAGILQGAAVKMFTVYQATTPFGVMFKRDSGIAKPTDLEGKSYGDFPGSATYALFPAFAKKAGVDIAKVKIVNISPAAQFSALLDGQVSATFTALNDSYVTLTHRGTALGHFGYAEAGLSFFSQGLIASAETLKNADLVKRFAKGFAESVAAMKADPAKAAAATKRLAPQSPDVAVQIDMIKDTVANRLTNAGNAGKPSGWMAPADWTNLVDLLHQYGSLKEKVAIDRLYTNDFIAA
jgi:NitT/TauT family transport system substrate-binding protein